MEKISILMFVIVGIISMIDFKNKKIRLTIQFIAMILGTLAVFFSGVIEGQYKPTREYFINYETDVIVVFKEEIMVEDDFNELHQYLEIDAYTVLEYKDRIVIIVEVDENKNPKSELVFYKDNIVWWGYDK